MEISFNQDDLDWVQQNVRIVWVNADPAFAYTTGLWKHKLPELIVVGMNAEQTGSLLNLIAARMRKYGAFKLGDIDLDLFTMPTKFGAVALPEIMGRMTATFERAFIREVPPLAPECLKDPGVLQVLWPDRVGIFPDERGFSREFASQTVLA